MPDTDEQRRQFAWVALTAKIALIGSLVLIGLLAAIGVGAIVVTAGDAIATDHYLPLVVSVVALTIVLMALVWVPAMYGMVRLMVANENAVGNSAGRLSRLETLIDDQGHSLDRLISLSSLSDKAKSLIYRDRELEAMQEVIHDDMIHQDYNTAEALIEIMDKQFGYADQAARLREELIKASKATLEEKIEDAIGRVHKIIEMRDWVRAERAAEKIRNAFPDHTKAAGLPQMVQSERDGHKKQLLQEYGEAVRKNDVNLSIELLRELDLHLSRPEAAALEESARGVFKAKLHNLGVQFAICVTDQRWSEAVATGEEIMRGFPNSRMCHEVRQKMPQLRDRMAEAASQS